MRRIIAIALALTTAALLTSCERPPDGSVNFGQPDSRVTLVAGDCLADAAGLDSDRHSGVPCTRPHVFDVLGTATWPDIEAHVSDLGAERTLSSLNFGQEDWAMDYARWASDTCQQLLRDVTGLSELEIDGRSPEDIGLLPGGNFAIDYSLDTQPNFVAGDHSTVCSTHWLDTNAESVSVEWAPDVDIRDLLTDAMPVTARYCFDFDSEDYEVAVSCDEGYWGQRIAQLDVGKAIGADHVKQMIRDGGTADQWTPIDSLCGAVIEEVLPGLVSNTGWGSWSTAASNNWTSPWNVDETYLVSCNIVAPEDGETTDAFAVAPDGSGTT